MKLTKYLFPLLLALALISCKTTPKEAQEQSILVDFRKDAEKTMEHFEPRDGVMSLLADAQTGEILLSVDLPENGEDRTSTYLYEPGPVFDVFRDSAIMHLPETMRDSDKAFHYIMNQFGFTEYPLVTAQQMVKAALVFANHGMMGDIEVISPKVADKMLNIMDETTDIDDTAMVCHKDANAVSSLAFYPAEDPQYIMYVVVLRPSKGGTTTNPGNVDKIRKEIYSAKL
ncbi:MAG: hypothetical protein IKS89_01530 [Spirochaetales bacterium]|nr:hypothetical protein [Spirochaetales bacterium]